MNSDSQAGKSVLLSPYLVFIFAIVIGFCLRFYACINTPIINSDGVHYISQAKAIYYGEWNNLTGCFLTYVSNYPILIAGAYDLFHNWVTVAKAVSLIFGTGALIVMGLLLRRFFDSAAASLCLLIYALIPVFVHTSGDVFRDPIAWFFITLGLYFFTGQADSPKYRIILILSCLSFLMAVWARVESILFLIVSSFYLLFSGTKRLERLLYFISPLIPILLVCIAGLSIMDISINALHRIPEIAQKFTTPLDQYEHLRESLKTLASSQHDHILDDFLLKSRNLIWLIALGTILNNALEAFFYPFVPFFIIGLIGIKQKIKNDTRVFYLFLLCICGFCLLYAHVIDKWIMVTRFFGIVIIPACIFAGFGIEKIIQNYTKLYNKLQNIKALYKINEKLRLKKLTAVGLVFFIIIIFGIPKNIKHRETDKAIFRQIGEYIAKMETNDKIIHILAMPSTLQEWVMFYANLNYAGSVCETDSGEIAKDYESLVRHMKENNIKYLLWEQRLWRLEKIDFIQSPWQRDFFEVGKWRHPNTDDIRLFVIKNEPV